MNEKFLLGDFSYTAPKIQNTQGRGQIINFGTRNDFDSFLLNAVNSSPITSMIKEKEALYIQGAGFRQFDATILQPNLSETWGSIFEKITKDYVIFNAFAVQAILNEDGVTFSFFHQPVHMVRLCQMNERNQVEKAFLCSDWRLNYKRIPIKMFGSETPQKGEPYLLYFKDYAPSEFYYAIPKYMNSWVLADGALSKYYVNYINNNFSCTTHIAYPYEPSEEKKEEIYDRIKTCFSGAENAGGLLLTFGENDTHVKIEALESRDADLYNQVAQIILQYLCSSNGLTSPLLAGLQTNNGAFSSKSDELQSAYDLYMTTTIQPKRKFILNRMNDLLTMNGYDRLLVVDDFSIKQEMDGQTTENDEKEAKTVGVDTDNVE